MNTAPHCPVKRTSHQFKINWETCIQVAHIWYWRTKKEQSKQFVHA